LGSRVLRAQWDRGARRVEEQARGFDRVPIDDDGPRALEHVVAKTRWNPTASIPSSLDCFFIFLG
jgi:hypothetical protein